MKTIIAGSRSIEDFYLIDKAVLASGFEITEVVSGNARGVDRLGEQWALEHRVPVTKFPAEWDTYGKSAGMVRNAEMATYADAAVILWDGVSVGTSHMVEIAYQHGIEVFIYMTNQEQ